MFPWQGEGKSAICPPKSDNSSNMQEKQQPSDATYLRWRLPSALQRNQNLAKSNNIPPSSSSSSSPPTAAGSESVMSKQSSSNEIAPAVPGSGDGQPKGSAAPINRDGAEDEEEGGRGDDESDGDDIDFRVRDQAAASYKNANDTGVAEIPEQEQDAETPDSGNNINSSGNNNKTPRNNHARRLNTKEEIKLFELCNKYASSFGERSKLCEWWKNIADEFVRNYGGPYSWHSVRRKVEIVTKQRIRYLADVKKGEIAYDQATEPWRKVLDEWIPTWESFESAERRRIEVRDARAASRKRKEAPTVADGRVGGSRNGPPPPGMMPWQVSPQRWPPYMTPYGPAGPHPPPPPPPPPPPHMGAAASHYPPPTGMKMPEGYDTMFRAPNNPNPYTPAGPGGPGPFPAYPTHHHMVAPPTPSSPSPAGVAATPSAQQTPMQGSQNELSLPTRSQQNPPGTTTSATATSDSTLTSAVLETLVKLNKHLEKASGTSSSSQLPSPSPLINALTNGSTGIAKNKDSENNAGPEEASSPSPATATATAATDINTTSKSALTPAQLTALKDEIRVEMQHELQLQIDQVRKSFMSKLDALEQTQEMIMDMLRQEPGREKSAS